MKKLSLDLDALQVESFDTQPVEPGRGTVHAAQCYCSCCCSGYNTCYGADTCEAGWTCNNTCAPYQTCPGYNTCVSCNTCPGQWTCDDTCNVSCYFTDCRCGTQSDGYRFCPVEPY